MSDKDGKVVKKPVLLYPNEKPGDRIALEFYEEGMLKERGRIMRAMLLTGAAFMQVDKRLPFMIAELFDEKTTMKDIQRAIASVVPDACGPDEDMLRAVLARLGTSQPPQGVEEELKQSDPGSSEDKPTQSQLNEEATRNNSRALFGED